jgi:hypothetical protein
MCARVCRDLASRPVPCPWSVGLLRSLLDLKDDRRRSSSSPPPPLHRLQDLELLATQPADLVALNDFIDRLPFASSLGRLRICAFGSVHDHAPLLCRLGRLRDLTLSELQFPDVGGGMPQRFLPLCDAALLTLEKLTIHDASASVRVLEALQALPRLHTLKLERLRFISDTAAADTPEMAVATGLNRLQGLRTLRLSDISLRDDKLSPELALAHPGLEDLYLHSVTITRLHCPRLLRLRGRIVTLLPPLDQLARGCPRVEAFTVHNLNTR